MAALFRRIGGRRDGTSTVRTLVLQKCSAPKLCRNYVSFVQAFDTSAVRKTLKIGLGSDNMEKLCLFLRPSDTTIW